MPEVLLSCSREDQALRSGEACDRVSEKALKGAWSCRGEKPGRTRKWSVRHRGLWCLGLLFVGAAVCAAELDADGWRKPTPEELAMTGEPRAPGAAAVYLYTRFERDDETNIERIYRQIKILTEEGRRLANVEIDYDRKQEWVGDIEARVVQPDGRVVLFDGTIYNRPLATGREFKHHAMSFALQDVRVGSVIEYRYRRRATDIYKLYNSRWLLSQDLYTRLASWSLRVYDGANLRWMWPRGLPPGTSPPALKKGYVRLETRDVPAFVSEPYMPPPDDLKYRVEFYYGAPGRVESDAGKFWSQVGKEAARLTDRFATGSSEVRTALARIVVPGDSAEQKARKIYDHVRQLRNASYEPELDRQEARRSADREARNAGDVAKNGYGSASELLLYFLALARAADIPATPVEVAGRSRHIFTRDNMLAWQLDSRVIALQIDGREILVDPSLPWLPFGALHWSDTAVQALRLDRDGGKWITTPLPRAPDALTRRKATLTLSTDGELEGTVSITYAGHEAVWRLMREHNEDEQARLEFLRNDLGRALPEGAEVKVLGQPDWQNRDGILQVEYGVRVPQWALPSGERILVGLGLFGREERFMFVDPHRVHPVYFTFPFRVEDQIDIALPPGYGLQGMPAPRDISDAGVLVYSTSVESRDGVVGIRRDLTVETLLSATASYPRFRTFFQSVRTGDDEQVVLARQP